MTKQRLIDRLKWYYPLERLHTFVTFPGLLLYLVFTNQLEDIVFLAYGIIVCIVILYQGQHYWKLKLKRLEGEKFDNDKNIKFFKSSKKINLILIGLIPILLLIQLFLLDWNIRNHELFFWGVLANIFAILEHVNYYNIQLMIDNKYDFEYLIKHRKLKKASLAKDLIEHKI